MFYRNRLSLTLWDSLPLSSGSRSIRSKIACALVFICSVHGLLLSGVLLSDVRANENEVKLRQYSHYAQRSGKTLKFKFTCTGERPATGEGEFTLIDAKSHSGRLVADTVMRGQPARMEMDSSGRWLGADCGEVQPRRQKK